MLGGQARPRREEVDTLDERANEYADGAWTVVSLFFFQAEDGIRAWSVTGVQTCALPISSHGGWRSAWAPPPAQPGRQAMPRSEERRVGKECRSRRGRQLQKEKQLVSVRAVHEGNEERG